MHGETFYGRNTALHQLQWTNVGRGPIWPKFELVWDFMHIFVSCKFDEDRIKTEGVSMQNFSHYKSVGAFCCHGKGNHSFDGICS